MRREGGFALLSVLILLALLVPLVVGLSYKAQVQLAAASHVAGKLRSREIARAGLSSALLALKRDEKDFDSYLDEWGEFEQLSALSAAFFEEGSFSGRIEDEEGKININHLVTGNAVNPDVEAQLTRLIEGLKGDTDIIGALADWLDPDEEPGLTGAEDAYYGALENPGAAKNGRIENLPELRLIKGMTDDIFLGREGERGLSALLTTRGDRRVNVNTAPYEVLMALSAEIDPALAEAIVAYRERDPFRTVEDLAQLMDQETFQALRGKVKVSSSSFSVTVRGTFHDVTTDIRAVVSRQGEQVRVISYSEV